MHKNYLRIQQLIHFIEKNVNEQPSLDDLAREIQLSPFYLQKMFNEWAGVSPKQYLQLATLRQAKHYLLDKTSILDASLQNGLSSTSRLYDHFVSIEAITPGEFKSGGSNLDITYGHAETIYGQAFIAWTKRGIHQLLFSENAKRCFNDLRANWPNATLHEQQQKAAEQLNVIFSAQPKTLHLHVRGSNFQINVWKALLSIPPGSCLSYGDLASIMGKPRAARAVGSAVGANALAVLIPCHRVIQRSGLIGNYRWGEERKRIILARENCLQNARE